jgi:hypothetical protein
MNSPSHSAMWEFFNNASVGAAVGGFLAAIVALLAVFLPDLYRRKWSVKRAIVAEVEYTKRLTQLRLSDLTRHLEAIDARGEVSGNVYIRSRPDDGLRAQIVSVPDSLTINERHALEFLCFMLESIDTTLTSIEQMTSARHEPRMKIDSPWLNVSVGITRLRVYLALAIRLSNSAIATCDGYLNGTPPPMGAGGEMDIRKGISEPRIPSNSSVVGSTIPTETP